MSLNPTSLVTAQANRKSYRYEISNSLRFRGGQQLLSPTLSSPDTNYSTLSWWVKRGRINSTYNTMWADNSSWHLTLFNNTEALVVSSSASTGTTTSLYRDPTAWYHIVVVNNNGTYSTWVNGKQVLSAGSISLIDGQKLSFGIYTSLSHSYNFDGYLAEVHYHDGFALDIEKLGRYDKYGNWVPIKVCTGACGPDDYGPNGFYLDFSDVTDIGADRSGNNNHFTHSGFDTTITTDTVTNITTSTGTDYLSGATYSGTWKSTADQTTRPPYAFDSSLGTYFSGPCRATTGSTQSCNNSSRATSTVTLGSAIPVSSSLRVYYRGLAGGTNYGGSLYFHINNTQYGSGSGGPGWVTVPGVTSITSIGIDGSYQSDNCCASASLYAIEVDGVILKSNDTEYTLTFNTGTSISSLSRGDIVYQSPSVYGTVLSVDSVNNQITLGLVNGVFNTNQTVYKDLSEQDNYFNYDYMKDSPTNNYATWSSLTPFVTESDGNLNIDNQRNCITTFGKLSSGKYYFEWNATSYGYIGVTDNINSWGNNTTPFAHSDDSLGYFAGGQSLYRGNTTAVTYGSAAITSGTLAMAVDFDNGTIEYFHNGSSLGSATDATSALTPGKEYYIAGQGYSTTHDIKTNFGQQPFRHTPPTGYYPLARKYLPAQKFINGENHFKTIKSDATSSFVTSGTVTNVTNNGGKNWSFDNTFYLYYGSVSPGSSDWITNPNDTADAIMLNLANTLDVIVAGTGFFYPGGHFDCTLTFNPALPNASVYLSGGCDVPNCTTMARQGGDARPEVNTTVYDFGHTAVVRAPSSGTQSIDRIKIRSFCNRTGGYWGCGFSSAGKLESNGSRKVFVDDQVVLEFANASDVSGFTVGDIVYKQGDTSIRGEVESINSASSPYTITVRSNSTWNNGDIMQTSEPLNEGLSTFANSLWWIKDRDNSNQHQLVDSVRSLVNGKRQSLHFPTVNAGTDYTSPIGNSVAWGWNYNSSNPDINGFEIITYTGDGSASRDITHRLKKDPEWIITKDLTTGSNNFMCYHKDIGTGKYIYLNQSLPEGTAANGYLSVSDTNYTIGDNAEINTNGNEYISYAWTSIPGYSDFGIYNGNDNADGKLIHLGFKPSFLMITNTQYNNYGWYTLDSTRDVSNPVISYLRNDQGAAEDSGAASVSYPAIDILTNGFKFRSNHYYTNYSSYEYIYIAFAEKPSFARNYSFPNPR